MPGGVPGPINEIFRLLGSYYYAYRKDGCSYAFVSCDKWDVCGIYPGLSPRASPRLLPLMCHLAVYLFIHHHLHPILALFIRMLLLANLCSCSVAYCDNLGSKATVRPRSEKSLLDIKYQSARNR